jgi:hypothetical protein
LNIKFFLFTLCLKYQKGEMKPIDAWVSKPKVGAVSIGQSVQQFREVTSNVA